MEKIIAYFSTVCQPFLTLSLLVALIFRADDHHFSVSLDDLALIAHGLDGRTYFHGFTLLVSGIGGCCGQPRNGIAAEMCPNVFWDAVP